MYFSLWVAFGFLVPGVSRHRQEVPPSYGATVGEGDTVDHLTAAHLKAQTQNQAKVCNRANGAVYTTVQTAVYNCAHRSVYSYTNSSV